MESDDGVPDDTEADIPTKFDLDEQGPTFVDTSNHPNNLENQKAKENEEEEIDKHETNAKNESDTSCPPGFEHMKQSIPCQSQSSFTTKTNMCSTSVSKYRKKDIRGISLIHEMSSLSRGRPRGLISIWDPNLFSNQNIWCHDSYIIVESKWVHSNDTYYMINVYGPQNSDVKAQLWYSSHIFMHDHNEIVSDSNPDVRVTTLDRLWSDHNPVMFHVSKVDYGPIPFKNFHSWLHRNDLVEVIKSGYSNALDSSFYSKLKSLKQCVKEWHLNIKHNERSRKQEISTLLKDIEIKLNACRALEENKVTRVNLIHEFNELKKFSEMDVLKKSHVKWGAEGDENTKFFHGLLKYIDFVQSQLGFGSQWRKWIRACLPSARTSILVNGSPSLVFSIKHGLRQGDPLSPFLFIIVMEGLHLAINEVVQTNLIRGAVVGAAEFNGYHFFFVDDVVIITKWSNHDMDNLKRVLHVFHLASGLNIKMHKSNVFGVGVPTEDVFAMARGTGCEDQKKMAWVKWDSVLASLDKGGLGVGSLKAFNRALLLKWRWRFVNNLNALWYRLIKAIHVGDGSNVRFWKDTWFGDVPLEARYNRLFHLDSHPNCLISDRLVNDSWQWSWSRQSLGVSNNNSLSLLLNDLHGFQLGSGLDFWQ
ncbi:RNA-directed DNA polymerase, eukaryota, reverse transcriptase zinc-binding domain protein [Tanacetum coccineum]